MTASDRGPLVDALADFDRLLEVGVGTRPEVARELAARGREVVAIDVRAEALPAPPGPDPESEAAPGSLRFAVGDVLALADSLDPAGDLGGTVNGGLGGPFDAVYACNLPAELQRPTRKLAHRLDATFAFTTLGFEEPVVPAERRTVGRETLYVVEPQ
ncbi:hypothetical protein JCM17823_19910 [Halorubrum gandharaense]